MTISKEKVKQMKEFMEVQGQEGNYNYSPYMLGMYNGMEFMLSVIEDRNPVYKEVYEDNFLCKRELPIH